MAIALSINKQPINGHRKYFCDFDFFERVDSEEKAYWLGFLAADGCVRDDGVWVVALSGQDADHLKKLNVALKSTYPIHHFSQKANYNDAKRGKYSLIQNVCRIAVSSIKMCNDLTRLGVTPRKTKTLQFPSYEQVPLSLMHHFVRGYFDGDGCLSKTSNTKGFTYRVEIAGTQKFITKMAGYFLAKYGLFPNYITFQKHLTSDGILYLRIASVEGVHRFRDCIYKDATVFLERKRRIFAEVPNFVDAAQRPSKKIEAMFHEGEPVSFRDVRERLGNLFSHHALRVAFSRQIASGSVNYIHHVGRHKYFIYEPEEENDPFRFES